MGLYDRDYQRDESYDRASGFEIGGGRTLTTNLVIVMIAIYVIQLVTRGQQGAWASLLARSISLNGGARLVSAWRIRGEIRVEGGE